ncbi:hypothetical protein GCM10008986_08950 [Salinibacillus aidingensis]|uniref:Uncharacterized protein n=1 Tax=Salinibacillus aidingensis TaxID=237684 RepID=A0ABP3KRS8_9BACI
MCEAIASNEYQTKNHRVTGTSDGFFVLALFHMIHVCFWWDLQYLAVSLLMITIL